MRSSVLRTLLGALVAVHASAGAATLAFTTDPFAGSDALTTPGRQIVGGELFTDFNVASDVFAFDPSVFGIGPTLQFANDVVENLPAAGANVIVLRTFDNDADPATPFGAGNAANLIAGQLTSTGAGFFVYFNSGLDLPRLVFSTDLGDDTSDLKVLARMTNLGGQAGRDTLATFTAANFAIAQVPEPATVVLLLAAAAFWPRRRGTPSLSRPARATPARARSA